MNSVSSLAGTCMINIYWSLEAHLICRQGLMWAGSLWSHCGRTRKRILGRGPLLMLSAQTIAPHVFPLMWQVWMALIKIKEIINAGWMRHVFCWIMHVPRKNNPSPSAQQLKQSTCFSLEKLCVWPIFTWFCVQYLAGVLYYFTLLYEIN